MSNISVEYSDNSEDNLSGKYLTFFIGGKIYGIELSHVIEIISIQSITPLPNVPDYIKGIINLRGQIVPILDVHLKFKQAPQEYNHRSCFIVVEVDGLSVGLIVDSVSEVIELTKNDLKRPPEFSTVNSSKYIKTLVKMDENIISILDCFQFLNDDSPLNII